MTPVLGKNGDSYVTAWTLYCVSPEGKERWWFHPDTEEEHFDVAPTIGPDGTLYLASSGPVGRIYAVSPDGRKMWVTRGSSTGYALAPFRYTANGWMWRTEFQHVTGFPVEPASMSSFSEKIVEKLPWFLLGAGLAVDWFIGFGYLSMIFSVLPMFGGEVPRYYVLFYPSFSILPVALIFSLFRKHNVVSGVLVIAILFTIYAERKPRSLPFPSRVPASPSPQPSKNTSRGMLAPTRTVSLTANRFPFVRGRMTGKPEVKFPIATHPESSSENRQRRRPAE